MSTLAIIGGTGLASFEGLASTKRVMVHTPFGEPSGPLTQGRLCGMDVVFLARHGYSHNIPPHKINYRANIWALKDIGVDKVIAVAAVGGIEAALTTGQVVIPHQLIDYTYSRAHTFFEDGLTDVTHIDFTQPYSEDLRQELIAAAQATGVNYSDKGVYGATQGPRLETAAEIDRMERDGCTLVGMTGMPEAALARELELDYATCAVIANMAAGRSEGEITMEQIQTALADGMTSVRSILESVVTKYCKT